MHPDECKVCGHRERFVVGDKCTECARVAEKKAAAIQAAAARRVAQAEHAEGMANLGRGFRASQQRPPSLARSRMRAAAAAAVLPTTPAAEPALAYQHRDRWAGS